MNTPDSFVDEATLEVVAGHGGRGCVSFRREKFVPRGGPDGGDGGRGGDVTAVANRSLRTLSDFRLRSRIEAGTGGSGGSQRRSGRSGPEALVWLPVGTVVRDLAAADGDPPLVDLLEDGQRCPLARGGRGGRGNARFASASRQAPVRAQPGLPGERRDLHLTLKLLAEVGLIGLPNAGKSTLLARISAARPRVAPYPFTTRVPHLGIAELGDERWVVADTPGLIAGASRGSGLGHRFLRHIERTGILVHVVDVGAAPLEGRDPLADYRTVRSELAAYSPELAARREIVALNKVDLLRDGGALRALEARLPGGTPRLRISAASGEGLLGLRRAMVAELRRAAGGEGNPGTEP